jgi:hypothetical protein
VEEAMPPWVVMWEIAASLFVGCKLLTWWATPVRRASAWRQLAYLIAWPGLDATAFLEPHPLAAKERPGPGEWLFAVAKSTLGAAIIWLAVPALPTTLPFLQGWIGMAGIVFLLHFGLFHILSCGWRVVGVDAKPLMNWPILATSVADFWGRRWNVAFRDITMRFLFRPLAKPLGPRVSLALGFLISGILHELVISLPAGGGYGGPTFLVQGAALIFERSPLGRLLSGRFLTGLIVAGPAAILFHQPFVMNVMLPFLDAIGAR